MAGFKRFFVGSPQALLISGFAGLIGLGTFLLSLPWAHQTNRVGVLDALFTATSAVCVTGLAVVDTGTDFSLFGQTVILLLIQIGGLGVMTFAGLAILILGGRLTLTSQAALADTFLQRDAADQFYSLFKRILILTFSIEALGALLLFVFLPHDRPALNVLGSALFHSVSAFCNAGFSLYSDSLLGLRDNKGVVIVIMLLIVLGGIGHLTLTEFLGFFRRKRDAARITLSHHSKIVFLASGVLLFGGALALLLLGMTPDESGFGDRLWGALFQSVTARTAGFNTVEIGRLPLASLFFMCILMFVGGSPGSCAGGIKTTTTAIWLARLKCRLMGRSDTVIFGRSVPVDIVRRVSILMGLALIWNVLGTLFLLISEHALPGANLESLLFEQISAFATVGLSTGVTPQLSVEGQLWIVLTMFIGRLGPLTLAFWAIPMGKERIGYPEGKVMIG